MNDGIQIVIGICAENDSTPMQFIQFDDGVKFVNQYTVDDLNVASAVLRDLADALDVKINLMTN